MELFQGALGGCHCEWRHMLQVHQTCPEVEERHPDTQSRHLSGDDDGDYGVADDDDDDDDGKNFLFCCYDC